MKNAQVYKDGLLTMLSFADKYIKQNPEKADFEALVVSKIYEKEKDNFADWLVEDYIYSTKIAESTLIKLKSAKIILEEEEQYDNTYIYYDSKNNETYFIDRFLIYDEDVTYYYKHRIPTKKYHIYKEELENIEKDVEYKLEEFNCNN